ncbi:MAG: sigma 54-interacting transcriptional regulator [Proteobacteria bacterium]|nr:sigma 54-interacting transcriptional regulator [Pseudomonadota bacterium]MBU1388525.1 sigma 54-interacting transcriptional regulator [Pseudomonadota bacterium]MBU1544822.1 sigma 54-interacting transcriptional regulator [Pseudomonadota bacterium]
MNKNPQHPAESCKKTTTPDKQSSSRAKKTARILKNFDLIFNSIHDGAVVIDADGYIAHFNQAYSNFLGIDPDYPIGKHCTEIIENTRMHIVAKTGKPEINRTQHIKSQEMMVQRIPLRLNGKIIGVYGQVIFKDIKEITKLASRLAMLESKIKLYEKELINLRSTRYTMESIVGVSDVISKLKMEALKATSNKFPVLITGDSGTGKELFAQAIHHASPRKLYPFIRLNCAAIPGELLESELFGYEKGAFTGANPKGKPGKFELAHRGSIFLDEIGELPLKMQPKLLRVLEEKEFERIGGMSIIKSDFRLIAATNRNLEDMVAKGLFRRDLFYRLNVIPLQIPPLRERREDIIPLARHLLKKMTQDAAFAETHMDEAVETLLCNYDWKGNVRELTNVLEQALSSVEGDTIRPDNLPFYLCGPQKNQGSIDVSTLKQAQIKAEKEAIQTALEKAGHNKTRAAEMLGIHRTLLYKKADKYAISLAPEK